MSGWMNDGGVRDGIYLAFDHRVNDPGAGIDAHGIVHGLFVDTAIYNL